MTDTVSSGRKPWKRLLIVPPLLLGIAALVVAVQQRAAPVKKPVAELASKVRIIEVPSATLIPRALGFGTVQPGRVWEAVSQVAGKIIEIHPRLKKGSILPEGTVLLRIDPTDYQLAVARIEAEIRASEARIAETRAQERNFRASIAIENQSLQIATRELERKRGLAERGVGSRSAADREERGLLAMHQSVQSMRNSLNLIPAQIRRLTAEIAALRTRLADAELDLARTVIANPFDSRIASVAVELTQFVGRGKVMASADGIAVAEVTAQVPIDKMVRLIEGRDLGAVDLSELSGGVRDVLGLTPVIRLRSGDFTAEWTGEVMRVSDSIDPQTRTVGVIVEVRDPYRLRGGARPPLGKNMYVEVELRGEPRPRQVLVPRAALRGGRAFVVAADNRLEIRAVETRFAQGRLAVIESGLIPGERIVVTDLIPAIDGMLLDPVTDTGALSDLVAEAGGEGAIR